MSNLARSLTAREAHTHEPTIACPHCHAEIKLTESLAAPFLKSREAEFQRKETELREREAGIRRDRDALEHELTQRLALERQKVAEEEQRKARLALGVELQTRQREVAELNEVLKARELKLAEAQQAQANVVRRERELQEKARELDLTIEKRVSASVVHIQQKAKQEAEDSLRLKVTEKDQVIHSMQKQIEELRRKAEQGSQQLQGEVQELELESLLGMASRTTPSRECRGVSSAAMCCNKW